MADPTPAEEIRQAAVAITLGAEYARKAMRAVPGPPYPTADAFREALSRQFPTSWGMAQHVARWTPEAAQAVAALLEHIADRETSAPCGCVTPALAVARAINGGA